MAYADLPLDVWDTILEATSVSTAARFLATNRTVSAELGPRHRLRLEAQGKVQAWLTQRALHKLATEPLKHPSHTLISQASPALAALLGSSFPQVDGRPILNFFIVRRWLQVYIHLNGLNRAGDTFMIDANLGTLYGFPVGSIQPPYKIGDVVLRNLLPIKMITTTPEQARQLLFIYWYLTTSLEALLDLIPELAVLDPERKYLPQLHLLSPRGGPGQL